jgi:hypothetical protein
MTDANNNPDSAAAELRESQTKSVAEAVYMLWPRFRPSGFPSEILFDGVINGAALAMMHNEGMTRFEFADLLSECAEVFRSQEPPTRGNFHVVK